jgi:phosphoglycolate phosphatase
MKVAKPFRHVIWDWNGTLFDDVRLCVDIFNEQLERIGRPRITVDRYREIFDHPVVDFYRSCGFAGDERSLEESMLYWVRGYQARRFQCRLHSDASELLRELNARNIGQSVLSAHQHDLVMEMLGHVGIAELFGVVRGLDDHRAHSKLENGRALLAEVGVPAGEIVVIGDTSHDFEVAQALGTACILVSHGFQSEARLKRLGAPVVPNLAAARGLVL